MLRLDLMRQARSFGMHGNFWLDRFQVQERRHSSALIHLERCKVFVPCSDLERLPRNLLQDAGCMRMQARTSPTKFLRTKPVTDWKIACKWLLYITYMDSTLTFEISVIVEKVSRSDGIQRAEGDLNCLKNDNLNSILERASWKGACGPPFLKDCSFDLFRRFSSPYCYCAPTYRWAQPILQSPTWL